MGRAEAYSVGARRGTVASPADEEVRRIVRLDPVAVARWWATSLATGYLDDAASVYSPRAEVRLGGRRAVGIAEIERLLEELAVSRSNRHPDEVEMNGSEVIVMWRPAEDGVGLEAHMSIEDGEISDQELIEHLPGEEPSPVAEEGFHVEMVRHGRIAPGSVEAATEMVRRAAHLSGTAVSSAQVKLRQLADPAAHRPAIVEATLDLDGEVVRAHAEADLMMDAIDHVGHRLEDRLRHRRNHLGWVRPTDVPPEPGEWRHGNRSTVRTVAFDRPVEEREVVRHKSWGGGGVTVEEAAFDLEMLDHEFHLFTDLTTGVDSLLEVSSDGYVLQQLGGADAAAIEGMAVHVRTDPRVPPTLGLRDAIDELAITSESHLFFEDRVTRRGAAVYRRFDGNYGLITPDA